jgi:hypothetical protein
LGGEATDRLREGVDSDGRGLRVYRCDRFAALGPGEPPPLAGRIRASGSLMSASCTGDQLQRLEGLTGQLHGTDAELHEVGGRCVRDGGGVAARPRPCFARNASLCPPCLCQADRMAQGLGCKAPPAIATFRSNLWY